MKFMQGLRLNSLRLPIKGLLTAKLKLHYDLVTLDESLNNV